MDRRFHKTALREDTAFYSIKAEKSQAPAAAPSLAQTAPAHGMLLGRQHAHLGCTWSSSLATTIPPSVLRRPLRAQGPDTGLQDSLSALGSITRFTADLLTVLLVWARMAWNHHRNILHWKALVCKTFLSVSIKILPRAGIKHAGHLGFGII